MKQTVIIIAGFTSFVCSVNAAKSDGFDSTKDTVPVVGILLPKNEITSKFKVLTSKPALTGLSFFTEGQWQHRAENYGYNGYFIKGGISGGIRLFSIPLNSSVEFIYQDNGFHYNANYINVSFDKQQYLTSLQNESKALIEKKKSEIINQYLPDNINIQDSLAALNGVKDKLNTASAEITGIKNEVYKIDQQIKAIKSRGKAGKAGMSDMSDMSKLESLITDTSYYEIDTQRYELLKAKVHEYDSLNSRFQQLYLLYKNYQDMLLQLQPELAKYDSLSDLVNSATLPEKIKEGMRGLGFKSPTSYLDKIHGLQVGRIYLNISPFTIQNISIKGLSGEYYYKNIYLAAGWGMDDTPTFSFPPGFFGKKILTYGRMGLGLKENGTYTHLTFVNVVHSQSLPDGETKTINTIVGFEKGIQVFKHTALKAEVDKSFINTRPGDVKTTKEDIKEHLSAFGKTMAVQLEATQNIPRLNTNLTAGTKIIGARYVSLAVPYLFNNSKNYYARIENTLWNSKIRQNAEVALTRIKLPGYSTGSEDVLIRKELRYNMIWMLGRKDMLIGSFTPVYEKQVSAQDNIIRGTTTNSVTLCYTHSDSLKKVPVTTMANLTSTKTRIAVGENTVMTTSTILSLKADFTFSEKVQTGVSGEMILDQFSNRKSISRRTSINQIWRIWKFLQLEQQVSFQKRTYASQTLFFETQVAANVSNKVSMNLSGSVFRTWNEFSYPAFTGFSFQLRFVYTIK